MKRILFLACMPACFSTFAQNGLAPLPILLQWDNAGLKIQAVDSQNPATSLFELQSSGCFENLGQDLISLKSGEGCESITIDLTAYLSGGTKGKDNLAARDTGLRRIKIEKTNTMQGQGLQNDEFVVGLEGFKKPFTAGQKIIFKGLDAFVLEADEKARYTRQNGEIKVNVKDCTANFVFFKGGMIKTTGFEESLPLLSKKYNSRYTEYDGFIYVNKNTVGKKWDFAHVRDLITKYNITDFEDQPLSYLEDMLITTKGIGFKLVHSGAKPEVSSPYYGFFSWAEFINFRFERYLNDRQLKLISPYQEVFHYGGNTFFSNVEMIQFMQELKDLILLNVSL